MTLASPWPVLPWRFRDGSVVATVTEAELGDVIRVEVKGCTFAGRPIDVGDGVFIYGGNLSHVTDRLALERMVADTVRHHAKV